MLQEFNQIKDNRHDRTVVVLGTLNTPIISITMDNVSPQFYIHMMVPHKFIWLVGLVLTFTNVKMVKSILITLAGWPPPQTDMILYTIQLFREDLIERVVQPKFAGERAIALTTLQNRAEQIKDAQWKLNEFK